MYRSAHRGPRRTALRSLRKEPQTASGNVAASLATANARIPRDPSTMPRTPLTLRWTAPRCFLVQFAVSCATRDAPPQEVPLSSLPGVIVVEDDPSTRDEIVAALSSGVSLRVVAAVSTVQAAQDAIARLRPAFVVLDLGLPDGDGAAVISTAQSAQGKVLVLTVRDDPATVVRVMALGAAGYLVKEAAVDRVGDALQAVAAGNVVLSPAVTRGLLAIVPAGALEAPEALTPQEQRVLQALRDGETYAQIAERLEVTINTVRTHIRNLYAKLRVSSRHEALTHVARR